MYSTYALIAALFVLAFLLILYRPSDVEGFATVAVDPVRMPACTERSTDAQKLLARIAEDQSDDAAELRLLVSKLCCMEADIASPVPGVYRTLHVQYRTSQDMEPPSSFVGRCLRNAVQERDIQLVLEKYEGRGHELLKSVGCTTVEFDAVIARLQSAMTSVCLKPQPVMDRPLGARDMGFWEPDAVADLSQYQGISSAPK